MRSQPTDHRVVANVRAEIARRNLAHRVVAERAGLTQQALSRRMTEQTPFKVAELERIADVLEVSLNTLVGAA